MNSVTLSYWLNRMARIAGFSFCGVFDASDICDTLSQVTSDCISNRDYVFCINFDNLHWFLLILRWQEYKTLYLFDSLNVDLQHYDARLAQFVQEHFGNHFIELRARAQTLSSRLCGHFCLYYVYSFCVLRLPISQIEIRLNNPVNNDSLITDWYSSLSS